MAGRINYWQHLGENITYHIYNHAVGRENLFRTEANYAYFLERWKKYVPYLDVYAYCLMPNHFHFLTKVKPLDEHLLVYIGLQQTQKAEAFLQNAIPYHTLLEDEFKRLFSGYTLATTSKKTTEKAPFSKSISNGWPSLQNPACCTCWPTYITTPSTTAFAPGTQIGSTLPTMLTWKCKDALQLGGERCFRGSRMTRSGPSSYSSSTIAILKQTTT